MTKFVVPALIVLLFASTLSAQGTRTTPRVHPAANGSDFWFPIIQNFGTGGGKYLAVFVTSPVAATVNVQLDTSVIKTVSVAAMAGSVFNLPLAWEMTSSGIVENKAVHVWSDQPGVVCHFMSHAPYSSDGMYVFPTSSWGTEYVVAAYATLFESGGDDAPSEFAVVASVDNTSVTITPSADIRMESGAPCCSCLFASKGTPVTIVLNKGQTIQCKTTCVQDCDNFDMTGTVITSSNPVGVVGGTACTNIPCDFPFCDHVCDMLPPVDHWGRTYYTAPVYQPPGMSPLHSASTFLVVATKRGQIVHRFDTVGGEQVYFLSGKRYDYFWRNDINTASRWTSTDPFLLVQYINSGTYPDQNNGSGDPAEAIVTPVEQFGTDVLFQTPTSIGNQNPYIHYVTIVANSNAKSVIMDGVSVKSSGKKIAIDGTFDAYRLAGVRPGTHDVTSDMGVGVMIYGYGFDESYAWAGAYGDVFIQPPPPPEDVRVAPPSSPMSLRVADDGLTLRLIGEHAGQTHIELYNLLGVRVFTAVTDAETIDASTLANGVYFYRMESGDQLTSGKVAIAR